MTSSLMIYGANGFTGRLIAKEAAARGLAPILAGRNRRAIEELGRELGCSTRVFDLAGDVAGQLSGVGAVLHCAGPFGATSAPMLEACVEARAHYLDITGEFHVFERIYAMDARLKEAGIMAVPGVGFDVVPTEGIAALLKQRMPEATRVRVVFRGDRLALSRGTMKTVLEMTARGVLERQEGELRPASPPSDLESIEFREGPFKMFPITGGELVAIHRSTGIGNIQMAAAATEQELKPFLMQQKMAGLLRSSAVRWLFARIVDATMKDPTDRDLAEIRSYIRGDAWSAAGRQLTLFLETPQGYAITVPAALACAQRALAGAGMTGALAPSQLLGTEAMLALPGVVLHEPITAAARSTENLYPLNVSSSAPTPRSAS